MILRPRKKGKNTVDSGFGVGARSYGKKNIFYTHDGVQVRERKLGDRILYSLDSPQKWVHPWYTTVAYFTKESGTLKNNRDEPIAGFAAVVNPGFVNGIDPVVPGAPKITIGQKETSSDLLSGGDPVDIKDDAGLLDGPLIPLYGFIFVSRGIPAALTDLGAVGGGGGISVTGRSESTMSMTISEAPTNPRYVASTSIYLQCARPTHKMEVQLPGDFTTPVQFNIMYDFAMLDLIGMRARLMVGGMPDKPSDAQRRRGIVEDNGMDLWKIATVYLLSPEDPAVDDKGNPVVNEAWVPYVKHHTFWNLEYRWKSIAPNNRAQIGSDLSLLPLIGRYTVAPLATKAAMDSQINEITAGLFNATVPEGRFWTI
jgi:hypothetical protein